MQFLNNLKVAYKLTILAVLAVIGMIVIALTGFSAINLAQEDMNRLYTHNLMSVYYIGQSRYATRYAQIQAALYPYASTPELRRSRDEKYKEATELMDNNIVEFGKIIAGETEVEAKLAVIKADWDKFKQVSQHIIDLSQQGNIEQANRYYEEIAMPVCIKMGEDLAQLRNDARERAEWKIGESNAEIERTKYGMGISFLVVLALLIAGIIFITRGITSPLNQMMDICGKLRDGDFRDEQADVTRQDEFGTMEHIMYAMRKTINGLMHKTSSTTEQLAASSEELTASAHQSAQASEQVAQSVTNSASAVVEQQHEVGDALEAIDRVMESIHELNRTASQVADNASASNEQATKGMVNIESAVKQILNVQKIVSESAATVDKLGESSKEIGQIVETITGIAGQTNLLALNAAIEAARAGEQGRGFSVVADEVRKLAEESRDAAQRISNLVQGIQAATEEAVKSMHEGSVAVQEGTASVSDLKDTFESIKDVSNGVSDKVNGMSQNLKEVSTNAESIKELSRLIAANGQKVSGEMESVSAASEEQSASAEEIASASDALAHTAQDLQNSLQQFQF